MKVGVIGMGKMGLTHAAVLEALEPGCVAGVVEADRRAHGTIRSLGLKVPIYATLDELLGAQALDAAIVCTPTFTHSAVVAALLERKIPVLIEKPLAETLDKCRALAELAAKTGTPAAVGYSSDFDPLFQEAKRRLASGTLGTNVKYTAWVEHAEVFGPKSGWLFQKDKSGGGVVINPTPHMLHLLIGAFGEPTNVNARLKSLYSSVEDEATVELEHQNARGTLRASWSVPNKPALELSLYAEGEKGSLALSNDELLLSDGNNVESIRREDLSKEQIFELSPSARAGNYYRQDKKFLESVRLKKEPHNSIRETLRVDRLIDAIYASGYPRG